MKITEISIKRPTLVVVVFTILTLMGLLSYFSLNYELLPRFSPGVISVSTVYPGASPGDVANSVTKKVEDAVSGMENVKRVTSQSFESLSNVMIELNSGADEDIALQDAQRKINAILSDFPDDVETPSLNKFSMDDLPIMTLSATANMDGKELYDLIDKNIQPRLSQIEGVAQISILGGQEREIQVHVNRDRLDGYGLSLMDVQQAVLSSNLDFPTGNLKNRNEQVLIRLAGKYASVDELRNLVVKNTEDGTQVRLKDIADVQDVQKDVETIARVNRESALALQIQKQTDANAVEVSENVRRNISEIEEAYGVNNLNIDIANDTTEFTLEAADSVIHDLMIAVILVAAVMLLFLHSFRDSLIVMVAIPLSLIATFIGMKLFGFSLNLMSLLGLSLVVGILVDDAIVVIENIHRHMEMGKNRVKAAFDGAKEIGFTVTSITLVIVVVFLPISLTNELVSMILREFAVVVVISTMLSLLTSFTVVPWLSSRFGQVSHITGKNILEKFILWFERMLKRFTAWMTGLLRWALGHKAVTIIAVLVLLVASFMLIGRGYIGGEFIAGGDRGEFMVMLEMPKDASVDQTNLMTRRVEQILAEKPEIASQVTTVGQTSEDGFGSARTTAYKSEITVKLKPDKNREPSEIYATKLKKELSEKVPGVKIKSTPVSIMGTAENAPVELVVMGTDIDSVMAFAERAQSVLAQIDGATEVELSVEGGMPEVNVQIDRDKMASLGLTLQQVGATMQTAFSGNTDAKFRQGDYEYDINVRFDDFDRQRVEDVAEITFINPQGEKIKLAQFAGITEGSGPSHLERRDRTNSVSVRSQAIGRPSGTIVEEFTGKLEDLERPADIQYVFGGDAENQGESFAVLGLALMMSVVLIYLIMVALYDNYAYPLVVMFSLPLSVIGALLALALTNNTLNIFSIMGMIMLMGLVAKNAIILVDFTNQMKSEGLSTDDALVQANNARLRPILMTTIAMVFGMIPIALAGGGTAAIKNGMAWVIIGGLISSMFLTLIVVPVVYKVVDGLMARFGLNNPAKKRLINQRMAAPFESLQKMPGIEKTTLN